MAKWNGQRSLELLTFDLQGEMFAVEAVHVHEILDLVTITDVPHSDPFVRGLINVRGKVVPLADLRIKFGMEQKPPTVDTRIIVLEVEFEGEPVTVGIRADKVHEVTEIPASALQETPKVGMRWRPEFIRCIGKCGNNFMVVLDIARVFSAVARPDADNIAAAPDQDAA